MSLASIRKVFVLSLLLALVGVVSAEGQSRKEKQRSEKLVETGNTAARQKNFQEAVKSYTEALTLWPANAEAHYQKGVAHLFLAEYEQAVSELDLAQRNGYKPLIQIWQARAEANSKQKKFDEALVDVNSILASDSGNYRYLILAAEIHSDKGAYKEAADALTKAIPKAPNSADLYYQLADAKSKLGDIEGQAAAAEEAIKRNTQFLADSLLLLGRARYAQKRIPEAINAFSRALASRPDKLESYRQLAELYRSQSQIEDGIKTLEEGRSRNATNGEVYKDLSLFYSLAERNDDAVAAGKSATQLLPNDPIAHTNLCRAYYQSKKFELATASCNAALKIVPEDGESLFYLGRSAGELKRPDAEKHLRRAVTSLLAVTKDRPEDPDAFYMLGNAYADLQQNANALQAYRKAIDLNPKLTRAYFNIGVIQLNEKNKPGAMEQYNALLLTDKSLAERLKALIDTM